MIVSFTTTPSRISNCSKVVDAIVDQTLRADLIILNVPLKSSKTGELYEVPEGLKAPNEKLFINIVEDDLGPVTKLVPTIKYLRDSGYPKNTRIVYCDDDILYPRPMLESFSKTEEDSVWAASAFRLLDSGVSGVRSHNSVAAIAEGYGGVCVTLGMFGDDFFDYIDKLISPSDALKYSDDLILSNYFAKRGIPVKVNAKSYSFDILYSTVADAKKVKLLSEDIDFDPKLAEELPLSYALSYGDRTALSMIYAPNTFKNLLFCMEILRNEDELFLYREYSGAKIV